jgi:putative DNA methylase
MKAIERDFPLEEISQVAELESWRKEVNRPIYHIHKWWAKRLGSVFRAMLLGTMLDEDSVIWDQFYKNNDFAGKIVLDPFMGSGTTLGEALKLGCKVVGCDINPVSFYLVRQALSPVNEQALCASFERLETKVKTKIQRYYKSICLQTGQEADVLYAFWVKLIRCPTCDRDTRLFPKWIFASHAYPKRFPQTRALCPRCSEIHIVHYKDTAVTCPACRFAYNPQLGPAKRTTFVCEHCDSEHRIADTYQLSGRPPDHQLYALLLLLPSGEKTYKKPDAVDLALYDQAVRDFEKGDWLYPSQEILPGYNTDQAKGYNYHHWHQMFNPRQLLCLSILLQAIMDEPDEGPRQQLLLLFSGILEFNNMFCSFKGEGTGAVRPLFSHHILKPERTPLENNPWGTPKSSGSFSTLFERRLLAARRYAVDPFELRPSYENGRVKGAKVRGINKPIVPQLATSFDELRSTAGNTAALILSGNSHTLPIPGKSIDVIVTDPPYFDNVHYSELADFFYVWLRLALQKVDEAFRLESTRFEGEVQGTGQDEFRDALGAVLKECQRVLKHDGLLVFTFHHSKVEAWLALIGALRQANLRVVAAHPIKAEMAVATPKSQAKEPINLDIVLVCQPKPVDRRTIECATSEIVERTGELAERLSRANLALSKGDLFVIGMSQFIIASQDGLWQELGDTGGRELLSDLEEVQAGLQSLQSRPDTYQVRAGTYQLRLFESDTDFMV